jgi:SAM-dependent methyltransferase
MKSEPPAIDYDHSQNLHTLAGARAALSVLFADSKPQSLLDVGCGVGTWLKAALESKISDVFGVDGIAVHPEKFLVSKSLFRQQDFTKAWDLGRKFDAALCLEVAEHLDAEFAEPLIDSITRHADTVIFSAACPGQGGQHHLNCQWPSYWQNLFNQKGYACVDSLRWKLWDDERVEPWYRQNIFLAHREASRAGTEPRIPSVVHPAIITGMLQDEFHQNVTGIAEGRMPFAWYLHTLFKVLPIKIRGRLK